MAPCVRGTSNGPGSTGLSAGRIEYLAQTRRANENGKTRHPSNLAGPSQRTHGEGFCERGLVEHHPPGCRGRVWQREARVGRIKLRKLTDPRFSVWHKEGALKIVSIHAILE